jgi:hypothetical protein
VETKLDEVGYCRKVAADIKRSQQSRRLLASLF